ncbi:TPA: hypothetical protein HMU36_18425 [Escherichia coli]|nr:hypothetical protein [Escherichia coli]
MKMPAFEWVHVQLHQQKGMISLSPPTICNSALDGIGQRVNEITDMNAQIATAVEQQGAVSEDINRSIINIRDAADTNVQTGQNNLQSAKSVAQLTSALSELAKQFWEKRG